MKHTQIPFYARLLFVIGIGIALAVALDNIAIGIGVAAAFFAALVIGKSKANRKTGENNE